MATVVLSVAILGVSVGLLAARLWLVPGSELRGTCASNNPNLRNEDDGCWACGKRDDREIQDCEYRER